ncbi:MAG: nitrite reductase, copper-containing [Acetobacteraceae bacterium]|nr:nitrite reductase, copper-containing [Acetobacteraceae bacterium]
MRGAPKLSLLLLFVVLAASFAPIPPAGMCKRPPWPMQDAIRLAQAAAPATPDATDKAAAEGRIVFRKCQACHSLDPGKNWIGPSLAGVIGRHAGTVAGFNYSPAMKQQSNLVWSDETLDSYLAAPQKLIPGNRMPFPGLNSATDRQNVIAYLKSATGQATAAGPAAPPARVAQAAPPAPAAPGGAVQPSPMQRDIMNPEIRYTLRSGIADGRMVYIGVGGAIDGQVNPTLTAAVGETVAVTLLNGEGAEHDIAFPSQNARSSRVTGRGASTTVAFVAGAAGNFEYFCTLPGHRDAGMDGRFTVTTQPAEPTLTQADISHDPANVPPAVANRPPQTVRLDLESVEMEARLADGTSFTFWTFNRTIPGPFLRVRVGDTVEVHMKNAADSALMHSVDFHAASGPGGGAAVLQVAPGEEKSVRFKALVPGLYVYHCATPMVAEHIANGMYGMILVEPEGGLPAVAHEFYVMQGEVYTEAAFGLQGSQQFSVEKLLAEKPEYVVFNGAVDALTRLHPLHAKTGESVRIYFGVGGPNLTSSFHVIGTIFENVYQLGSLANPPIHGVQTVTVAPGGSTIVELRSDVPGQFTLVDHALARMEHGLIGSLRVEGAENAAVFQPLSQAAK